MPLPRPRLALVPGEPAGVGPELCVRLAQLELPFDLVVFGDRDNLRTAAVALALPIEFLAATASTNGGQLSLHDVPLQVPVCFGAPDPRNAAAVIKALTTAAAACLSGELAGMVTGPVSKAIIIEGGIAYTGTTELLAAHAGVEAVMMLANPLLRVALATTHLPLRAVPDAISREGLTRCLRILDRDLRQRFGIATPRIAVLGLNPHAGEGGHLGREEIEVIEPVIDVLRREGMTLVGPLPADSAFLPMNLASFDAVLAMYHDQGLPVLKHSGFEQAVNITLGLPFPRVAVDHGTAFELAGTGAADPSSLIAAAKLCARLAAG